MDTLCDAKVLSRDTAMKEEVQQICTTGAFTLMEVVGKLSSRHAATVVRSALRALTKDRIICSFKKEGQTMWVQKRKKKKMHDVPRFENMKQEVFKMCEGNHYMLQEIVANLSSKHNVTAVHAALCALKKEGKVRCHNEGNNNRTGYWTAQDCDLAEH
jgi:hypothetical protein